MTALALTNAETEKLNAVLANLEDEFGTEYIFTPECSEFSCKCSGPAQSCTWH